MSTQSEQEINNKSDRQLYVGNLPPNITAPELVKNLNDGMVALGLCKENDQPVLDAWISTDSHYAFVEFRSQEDASKGYQLIQISIQGYPLKVGKPRVANSQYSMLAQSSVGLPGMGSINSALPNGAATVQ